MAVKNYPVGASELSEPLESIYYLRRKQAAKRLGISLGLFDQLVGRKTIPHVQLSARVKIFRTADLDRALEKLTVGGVS